MAKSNEPETPESVLGPEPTGPQKPDHAIPESLPQTSVGLIAMLIRWIIQKCSNLWALVILLIIVVLAVSLGLFVERAKVASLLIDPSQKLATTVKTIGDIEARFEQKSREAQAAQSLAEEARKEYLSQVETYSTKMNALTEKEENLNHRLKELEERETRHSKASEALRQRTEESERIKDDSIELAKAILQIAHSPNDLV